jgi:hypothetical protein
MLRAQREKQIYSFFSCSLFLVVFPNGNSQQIPDGSHGHTYTITVYANSVRNEWLKETKKN